MSTANHWLWLQTVDSLAINGPHAIVIAPALTRIEMFRIARTYELCITRHWPVTIEERQRPKLIAEELFRGEHGYLGLELWGKDRDLSGCVRPQFFTRSGEEIDLPLEFDEAIKAATSGGELCRVWAPTLLATCNDDDDDDDDDDETPPPPPPPRPLAGQMIDDPPGDVSAGAEPVEQLTCVGEGLDSLRAP